MATTEGSLFLSRLTHDTRLAIYAYLVLPPFDNCRDYSGLWLSCRQLYNEIDDEGTRQLRIYLRDVARPSVETPGINDSSQDAARSRLDVGRCLDLQFIEPTSVLGRVVVSVEALFSLPPMEYDWHFELPQRFMGRDSSGRPHEYFNRPRTRVPRFGTPASERHICYNKTIREPLYNPRQQLPSHVALYRSEQMKQYGRHISKLLVPIGKLHRLHADIEIHLTADEMTTRRISHEFASEQKTRPNQYAADMLESTALGWLLYLHVHQVSIQSVQSMKEWRKDWEFNVKSITFRWNFCPLHHISRSQQLPRTDWKPRPVPAHSSHRDKWEERQVSCTDDRREGMIQLKYRVREYVQSLLETQLGKIAAADEKTAYSKENPGRFGYNILLNREKLRRLGCAGYQEPGSRGEREMRIEELRERFRDRTNYV